MAKTGRKGFYEELAVKKYLSELTPKMFKHVQKVMDGEDEPRKDSMVHKILPKIIDKGVATQLTGEEGRAIVIHIAKEIAETEELYESPQNASGNS